MTRALLSLLKVRSQDLVQNKPAHIVLAGFVPGEYSLFAAQLSERIAAFAPQLTLDFISEVSAAMPALDSNESISCLRYLSPWIKNLALFLDPTSLLFEKSVSRMRDCIRVLCDMTLAFPQVCAVVIHILDYAKLMDALPSSNPVHANIYGQKSRSWTLLRSTLCWMNLFGQPQTQA